jgi:hypothetical protein
MVRDESKPMTPKQLFNACIALAPDFRVCIEYTTMPTMQRVLVWHGRKPTDMTARSAGIPFPENTEFEPKLAFVLEQALAMLQQP